MRLEGADKAVVKLGLAGHTAKGVPNAFDAQKGYFDSRRIQRIVEIQGAVNGRHWILSALHQEHGRISDPTDGI
ncbi:hypothetical protein [Pseudooceanicola sp. HF7]|uniref:hypothetical protein n=1 Tax=Pseudooceanicola sp. HF7 TaxID=2721560 RepID=UPI001C37B34E|nr:hypothetical protein [Pseudooceanicola sp. HF7]